MNLWIPWLISKLMMPLELLLPVDDLLVLVGMTLYSRIRNKNRNRLMNPNPRRLDALAHLARIAQAAMMMTMMRTPTAP